MTGFAKQSSRKHEQTVQSFADNPYVNLSFLKDDFPPKYEVAYRIKGGRRQKDGSVDVHENHLVAILLPSGFPETAPTCIPLTPIFHPSFTPTTVFISDFWSRSKSLSGLIIHIGLMISGQISDVENPINPEAAKWYQENRKSLPFDSVNLEKGCDELSTNIIEDPRPALESRSELEPNPTDSEQPSFEMYHMTGQSGVKLNLSEISLPLWDEVKRTHLDQLLFDDYIPLEKTEVQEERIKLHFDPSKVASSLILDEENSPQAEAGPSEKLSADSESGGAGGDIYGTVFSMGRRRLKTKKNQTMVLLAVIVVITFGAYHFTMNNLSYKISVGNWFDSIPLLSQQIYKEVKQKGDLAFAEIDKIYVLAKNKADGIKKEITFLFQKEKNQGAHSGIVSYSDDGDQKENIAEGENPKNLQEKEEGDVVLEKWEAALKYFEENEKNAQKIKLGDYFTVSDSEKSAAVSQVNFLIEQGKKNLEEERFGDAVRSFKKAVEIADTGADFDAERRTFIQQSLEAALIRKFMKEGEGALSSIKLDKALQSFNQALSLAEKQNSSGLAYAKTIRKSIQQIKLYQFLEKGKSDYESSEWAAAFQSFQEASPDPVLLESLIQSISPAAGKLNHSLK